MTLIMLLGHNEFSWLLPIIDVLAVYILYLGFKSIDTENELWFGLVIMLACVMEIAAYVYDPSMIALTWVHHI